MNIYAKRCTWNYYKVQHGFFFIFHHKLTNQLPASGGLVADSAVKTTLHSKGAACSHRLCRHCVSCAGGCAPAAGASLWDWRRPSASRWSREETPGGRRKNTPPERCIVREYFHFLSPAATCRRVCVRNTAWQTLLYSERYQWVLRRFYYTQTADK